MNMTESAIASLRNDYRSSFFSGFERIIEDLRILSMESGKRGVNATYENDNSAILASFELYVVYKNYSYPIPMKITFFREYPHDPPFCRLVLLNERQHFKEKHASVDSSGTVYNIPSLLNWSMNVSIMTVISQIKTTFEKDLPIREGKATQSGPQMIQSGGQVTQNGSQVEIDMRRVLKERLDDSRKIMDTRIMEETQKLRTLDDDLSQHLHLAEGSRAEKSRDLSTLNAFMPDLDDRIRKMTDFLNEHPQKEVTVGNVAELAMPSGSPQLVEMIKLRSKLEAFDTVKKLLEDPSNNSISKETVEAIAKDFFGMAVSHFHDLYELQIRLNQFPEYKKFFV